MEGKREGAERGEEREGEEREGKEGDMEGLMFELFHA